MREVFQITCEPRGALYHALIDAALADCDRFLLVRCDETVGRFEARFAQFTNARLNSDLRGAWPGTDLIGHQRRVDTFRFGLDTAWQLKRIASGLFDWQCPTLPDDLCLLRPSGCPWLVTIAHERDAYLLLNSNELVTLRSRMPTLEWERALELEATRFIPDWLDSHDR